MLVVETVVRIRREHAAGKAIKAIARDLRLSRKVVRKAIRGEEGAFSYQRATQPFPKLGPARERLDRLLAENEARPRRERLKVTRIWDLLVREGYDVIAVTHDCGDTCIIPTLLSAGLDHCRN